MITMNDGLAITPTTPALVYRADYQPSAFFIDEVHLTFDLDPIKTKVLSRLKLRRNPKQPPSALRLDGEALNLARVLINGVGCAFRQDDTQLIIESLPVMDEPFELELLTTCCPEKNSQLMGLYVSQNTFFTQCEAEGFRRITYFMDRPDIMSLYTVTLRADEKQYPILLSNGNLIEQSKLPDGRHTATWHDPHKKPCYLFALVAGQLIAREQRIISRGREHLLQIYVRSGDLDKTDHAMQSLKASIAWDEHRFGLPLDLDRFMIVATSDFNMGAMENKGLNIFNTKLLLANPTTATDADYAAIESVVGHEYFHNWTGNRVTCRDWFQLSLKEGLTVFRDQAFSTDMRPTPSAKAVRRIDEVRTLRTAQFAEDAGPMAHPVRPDSYAEISNFYTVTIYEKGAEVVRMMETLVGRKGFAQGMTLYFERHDGQAVTCDDFLQAMVDANPNSPLAEHHQAFGRWYALAHTPQVKAQGHHDPVAQTFTLTLSQTHPAGEAQPFVIPVQMGLIGADGQPIPLHLRLSPLHPEAETSITPTVSVHRGFETCLVLTKPQQTWVFEQIAHRPIPSVLRHFSAPVLLKDDLNETDLCHLLAHDTDAFNRWESGQRLMLNAALSRLQTAHFQDPFVHLPLDAALMEALRAILRHPDLDPAFKAAVLNPPSEGYLAECMKTFDPLYIHRIREGIRTQLAHAFYDDWVWAWEQHRTRGAYQPDVISSGRRALSHLALHMLCLAKNHPHNAKWAGIAYQGIKDANNMTDRLASLTSLTHSGQPLAQEGLQYFAKLMAHEALVMDKWFAIQATQPERFGAVLPRVRQLMQHPDFHLHNPNRARSLIFSYCNANLAAFHRPDGEGYTYWAEQVLAIDAFNPQVAARLARALDKWPKLVEPYRSAARNAVQHVVHHADLSKDTREILTKSLHQS